MAARGGSFAPVNEDQARAIVRDEISKWWAGGGSVAKLRLLGLKGDDSLDLLVESGILAADRDPDRDHAAAACHLLGVSLSHPDPAVRAAANAVTALTCMFPRSLKLADEPKELLDCTVDDLGVILTSIYPAVDQAEDGLGGVRPSAVWQGRRESFHHSESPSFARALTRYVAGAFLVALQRLQRRQGNRRAAASSRRPSGTTEASA